MSESPAVNSDREIWRERPGDFYSDSIHVTEGGGIGINHGGTVIVMRASSWHALAKTFAPAAEKGDGDAAKGE